PAPHSRAAFISCNEENLPIPQKILQLRNLARIRIVDLPSYFRVVLITKESRGKSFRTSGEFCFGHRMKLRTMYAGPQKLNTRTGIKTRLKKIRTLQVRIKQATQVAIRCLALKRNWKIARTEPLNCVTARAGTLSTLRRFERSPPGIMLVLVVVLVLDLWDFGAEKESPILWQLFCSITLTARYAEFSRKSRSTSTTSQLRHLGLISR